MEAAEKPKSIQEHVLTVDSTPKQSPGESPIPVSKEKSQIPWPASRRLVHSKSKACIGDFNLPTKASTVPQDPQNPRAGAGSFDFNDEDGLIKGHEVEPNEEKKRRKWLLTFHTVIQWAAAVVLSATLVLSLTLHSLSHQTLWGLTIWKWCLTLLVVSCDCLFAGWVVTFVVFLIEFNFMLREKVLYFI